MNHVPVIPMFGGINADYTWQRLFYQIIHPTRDFYTELVWTIAGNFVVTKPATCILGFRLSDHRGRYLSIWHVFILITWPWYVNSELDPYEMSERWNNVMNNWFINTRFDCISDAFVCMRGWIMRYYILWVFTWKWYWIWDGKGRGLA